MTDTNTAQTQLTDLLRDVPEDARCIYRHNYFEYESIPIGRYCREALAEIERLTKEGEYGDTPLFDRTSLEERIAVLEIGNREKQSEIESLRDERDDMRKLVQEFIGDGVMNPEWEDRIKKAWRKK